MLLLRYQPSWLLLASLASAQEYIESLSFGLGERLSPNGRGVPHWAVSSQNHNPQILSDRVVLTPPVPGDTRGALWSDGTTTSADWTVDFEFRSNSQEQGTGNLQIWYAKDKTQIEQNSVYTVEQFDGFAVLIDQYGGRGGSVRGFLNDGTQSFKGMSSIESIAFGHCDYSYRNLGRPSKIRISSQNGLAVYVDDQLCFGTDKITLPSGYYFGVTAGTGENPDSFEIYKFGVSYANTQTNNIPASDSPREPNHRLPASPEALPDRQASDYRSSESQFEDLHNRLQGITHQIADMYQQFEYIAQTIDQRHRETLERMPNSQSESMSALNRKMDGIDNLLRQIQKDVTNKDITRHLSSLQETMDGVRGGLTEHLPNTLGQIVNASAPRMGFFLFIVVAVQILLAGAYVVYKRRRANAPKKFL